MCCVGVAAVVVEADGGGDGEGGAVFSGVNLTAVGIMQCDRSK